MASGAGPAAAVPTAAASAVYQRRCSVCHGERGDGQSLARSALATKPRDFTSESSRLELTREYMIAIVRDGRPGKPMVGRAVQLSQAQIEMVVDLVRTAFIPPDPGTPAGQGWALYRPLCSSCHGPRGEGGPARRGLRPAPALSLSRPGSTLTPQRLRAALADDAHVVAMDGRRLTPVEGQAVATYIEQAFIESIGRTPGKPSVALDPAAGH